MNQEDLNSWEEFKEHLEIIQKETQKLKANPHKVGMVSEPLYRGQPNHKWHLESTLERKYKNMTLFQYFGILERIKPIVERISNISWPTFSDIGGFQLESVYHFVNMLPNNSLGYITLLRQHGFPSPLLDWTSCPNIASYFAFERIDVNTERVAIYFFREQTGLSTNLKNALNPTMNSIGHNIDQTSQRHYKQKTQYTICLKKLDIRDNLGHYIISNMEEDINNPGYDLNDDFSEADPEGGNVVRKYTIPTTESKKVLRELESKGICRASLFEGTLDNMLIDLWNKYGM